jgi:hypothetical protein
MFYYEHIQNYLISTKLSIFADLLYAEKYTLYKVKKTNTKAINTPTRYYY